MRLKIKKITGKRLQEQLFKLHCPSDLLQWDVVGALDDNARAEQLCEIAKRLTNVDAKQHDHLCSALDVIDTIGEDSGQSSAIYESIKNEKDLYSIFWNDDFGIIKKGKCKERAHTPNNLAAWIYVVAKCDYKIKDYYPQSARAPARKIWQRLVNQYQTITEENGRQIFFLTPPKIVGITSEMRRDKFLNAYKELRAQETGIKDYPAICDVSSRISYIRFSTNCRADPHYSIQEVKDKKHDPFDALIDPNADCFKIDYYPERDYLRISKIKGAVNRTRRIAELFAEKALGSTIQDNRGKRHTFDVFKDRRYKQYLVLPEDSKAREDKVWISAMTCTYFDKDGNQVSKNKELEFPYKENGDIFDNIDKALGGAILDTDGKITREISDLQISFIIHNAIDIGTGHLSKCDGEPKPIHINIKRTHFDFIQKMKDKPKWMKEIVESVLKRCDLMPKTRDQLILGNEGIDD